MRLIDPLLMEFDREASTTRKVLERVPDAKFSWAPHPKSSTLGRLASHVATIPAWAGSALLSDGYDVGAATFAAPTTPATTADLLTKFADAVKSAKEAMNRLDDETALGDWALRRNGKPMLTMPRLAFVRTLLLNHSIHHRGQLTVYLRLLDVPLPPVYGPTADETIGG